MNIHFQPFSKEPFEIKDLLPPNFKGVRLPGGNIQSLSNNDGYICFQQYAKQGYTIGYTVVDHQESLILNLKLPEQGWLFQFHLKGHSIQMEAGSSKVTLQKNQFSIFPINKTDVRIEINKPLNHFSFFVFYSVNLVKELLSQFSPGFQSNETVNAGLEKITNTPKWLSVDLAEIIHAILHCRYAEPFRAFYFDSRVKDLLFSILAQLVHEEPGERKITSKDLDAVYLAEQLITADISKHMSIPELSKKVLLNEFRLKAAFKKVYGVGPYEYLIKLRMAKAKELLKEGKSVKEVAALTGYRPSDFTVAFTHHFGITPGTLKKRNS